MDLPINLYHLYLFSQVAECGSYSLAAQKLCLTQPALSIQIKSLEKKLGVALFVRKGHRIQLTEAGQITYKEAINMLSLDKKLKASLQEFVSGASGFISISSNHPVGRYLLPNYIIRFIREFPQVEISITYENSDDVMRSVLEGKAHVGFVSENPAMATDQLWCRHLYRDYWILVCGADSLWKHQRHDIHDIVHESSFISLLPQTAPGKLIMLMLKDKGVMNQYQTFLRSGDIEAIKTTVISHLGIAFLPKVTIGRELALGELCPVPLQDSQEFILDYYLIANNAAHHPPSVTNFIQFMVGETFS